MPKQTLAKHNEEAKKPNTLRAMGFSYVPLTFATVNFLRLFVQDWQKSHFALNALLPTADWHTWVVGPFPMLILALCFLAICVYFWRQWFDLRAKEQLAKQKVNQVVPTEGVWPPPPRME